MKKLLENYIKSIDSWDCILVDYYNIDGANCEVIYYTDESKYYKETRNINIWEMLIYLNDLKYETRP
jgi:hypothetical protein